jgi:hypothetical protein
LDFETATIEEKREDGIVKVSLTELKDIWIEDEILRWKYTGEEHDIILSDVAVHVSEGEKELLAVYNTMTCLGDDCGHK